MGDLSSNDDREVFLTEVRILLRKASCQTCFVLCMLAKNLVGSILHIWIEVDRNFIFFKF
jgi:hypothetical protein